LQPPPEFLAAAAALGIEFDDADLPQLARFLDLLLETNKSFNLTAITDPVEAWTRHILDALTLVALLADLPTGGEHPRVIDIGSGGGVPGIPLAIVMPSLHITLLEPTGKKAAFLRSAAETLGLTNVTVIQGRAENLGQDVKGTERGDGLGPHREGYDAATARALGHLAIVAELAAPLVKPGGLVLAVKGAKADQELEEAAKAIGLVGARHAGTVETPTGRIVVLEKATRTPRLYPRRDGEPKRAPLGLAKPA
jgi:16S rRNA (guanine527-N7)-methyltransferase